MGRGLLHRPAGGRGAFMHWRIARILLMGAAVLTLAGGARAALPGAGKPAPAWAGKTTDGKDISLAKYKGKVVLLNFFSYY